MLAQLIEKRAKARIPVIAGIYIDYFPKENGNPKTVNKKTQSNAMLTDITEEGIGFVFGKTLELNSIINISTYSTPLLGSCFLKAKIIWADSNLNRYGTKLLLSSSAEEVSLRKILAAIERSFLFEKTVYLADTNAEGNVYFARLFEWQGETREAYLNQSISKEEYAVIVRNQIRLLTVHASLDFYKPFWLFDQAGIRMTTRNIRHASLEMVFEYFNKQNGEFAASGYQLLAFQDAGNRLVAIPDPIQRIALAIEQPS